jgi:cardiolipin synthase
VLARLGSVDPSTAAVVSSRVWTVPNLLSMLRLALVPVFLALVLLEYDLAALLVLVFSTVTDYLDGVIARRFSQITRLGQLIDPAADRLFIFATILGLAFRDVIPWWLFFIILGRDILLLVLGVLLANGGFGPLPVHHLGKVATFCLFYALPLLMLGRAVPDAAFVADPLGWAFVLWGAFLYWWAGVIYAIETARVLRLPRGAESPASDSLNR